MIPTINEYHKLMYRYRGQGYRIAAYGRKGDFCWIEDKEDSGKFGRIGVYRTLHYRVVEKPWVFSKGGAGGPIDYPMPELIKVPKDQAFSELSEYLALGGEVERRVLYLSPGAINPKEKWETVDPGLTNLEDRFRYRAKELPHSLVYTPPPDKELIFLRQKLDLPEVLTTTIKELRVASDGPVQLQLNL